MLKSTTTSLAALAIASSFALAAAPAAAQATGDTDTPAADAQEGIEEILVTATRREENLQDIPLSVATVNDETLAAVMSGGTDIRGYQVSVAGVARRTGRRCATGVYNC